MDASFKNRSFCDDATFQALQQRSNAPTAIRFSLQLLAFLSSVVAVIASAAHPLAAGIFTVALAAVWTTLFAPFHECTHRTAFASRRLNAVGTWLASIPFAMAPSVYRELHFEHHRHTHDPKLDPEIAALPHAAEWPSNFFAWLLRISGLLLLAPKIVLLLMFAVVPPSLWAGVPWARPALRRRFAWESRIVAFVWIVLIVAAVRYLDSAVWLLAAFLLGHVFLALWASSEHTGLPYEGSILARTRTVKTSAFFRWWLWNMNYHAEHHAWPSIPWYRLPEVHTRAADQLEHVVHGYTRLQLDVVRNRARNAVQHRNLTDYS